MFSKVQAQRFLSRVGDLCVRGGKAERAVEQRGPTCPIRPYLALLQFHGCLKQVGHGLQMFEGLSGEKGPGAVCRKMLER